MNLKTCITACMLLAASTASRAAIQDLRTFMESANFATAQTAGALWTAHYGDAGGALLPPEGTAYGYPGPYYNTAGGLVNAGDGSYGIGGYVPTFNGIFIHPGWAPTESTDIVFTAQNAVTLTGVTVHSEMVVNGAYGNGVDIEVRHIRGSTITSLGSYLVSGPNLSTASFSFGSGGLLFAAGDRVEVDVGSNGAYWYDHVNLNVELSAPTAAPVPEPETYALLLAGLGLLGGVARRRRRH